MFCPKCGKDLQQNDFNACPYCGCSLHEQIQQNNNNGDKDKVIHLSWLQMIGIAIVFAFSILTVFLAVTDTYITSKVNTSTTTSTSKSKKNSSYGGYVNANSYVCADYDTLIELDDALRRGDKEHMESLFLSGKVFAIKTKTKAKIIDTGLLDKNAVSVIIEEGKHANKDGYTFKDWTSK